MSIETLERIDIYRGKKKYVSLEWTDKNGKAFVLSSVTVEIFTADGKKKMPATADPAVDDTTKLSSFTIDTNHSDYPNETREYLVVVNIGVNAATKPEDATRILPMTVRKAVQ